MTINTTTTYAELAANSAPPWVDWSVTVILMISGLIHLAIAYSGRAETVGRQTLLFRALMGLGMAGISGAWLQKLTERGDLLTLYSTQMGILMMAVGSLGLGIERYLAERDAVAIRRRVLTGREDAL